MFFFAGSGSNAQNEYLPDRPIGYGAFGVVWSVTDPRDGKRVALKKLPNVFQSLVSSKRVFRELKMMRFFKHENVLSCLDILQVLNYFLFDFELAVCLHLNSYSAILHACVQKPAPIPVVQSQNFTNKSCLACVENEKYASWVMIRPQWDCCCQGEAKVRIIDFKTTWSEFQMPSQTAPAEAKPRCVYSILKPHGQSSITSPDLVPSSCVRQHT